MSLSANSIQVRYIEQVKSTVINSKSKKIIFTPDLLRDGKKVENFYLKPVIVICPDQTFGINITCPDCKKGLD